MRKSGCILLGAIIMVNTYCHQKNGGNTAAIAPTNQHAIQWQKCLGGTGDDEASAIQQTSDGGYIVAGASKSKDGDVTGSSDSDIEKDVWIAKLDQTGKIVWQKSLPGTSYGAYDKQYDIRQTRDGGYIFTGYFIAENGAGDYWIVKLDRAGNLAWQKTLGGSEDDQAKCIRQTRDGGYIIAGYSYSTDGDVKNNPISFKKVNTNIGTLSLGNCNFWIVKTDSTGNIQWQKSLGGSGNDFPYSIEQTKDGGYIVAGECGANGGDVTNNHGIFDYWVVKLNDRGKIQWQKSLGGSDVDEAYCIQQTNDDGYIVAGASKSKDGDVTNNYGNYDYWIVKLNNTGSIQWQKSLGGSGEDKAYSVQQTKEGGFIVAGYSESSDSTITDNHGNVDYWIVKLDGAGKTEWQKSFGGSSADQAYSLEQTNDDGFIVAGRSASSDGDVKNGHGGYDYWIVKLK